MCRVVLSLLYKIPSAELYSGLSGDVFMADRLLQELNAMDPILVTEEGIVMSVRLLQPENAQEPILVTEEGIVMSVRLLQPEYMQPVIAQ